MYSKLYIYVQVLDRVLEGRGYMYTVQCTTYLCTGTRSCSGGGRMFKQVLKNVCTVFLCTGTESCSGGGKMYAQCTVYLWTGTEECMYSIFIYRYWIMYWRGENVWTVYCIFMYRYWRMYVQVPKNLCTIYLCTGTGSCTRGRKMELELLQLSSLYWRQG